MIDPTFSSAKGSIVVRTGRPLYIQYVLYFFYIERYQYSIMSILLFPKIIQCFINLKVTSLLFQYSTVLIYLLIYLLFFILPVFPDECQYVQEDVDNVHIQ